MKNKIDNRIKELQEEWTAIGYMKEDLKRKLLDSDERLSQISGALIELTALLVTDHSSNIQDINS